MDFDISKLTEMTNHQSLDSDDFNYDTSFQNDPHFIKEKSEFMKNMIPDLDVDDFIQQEMKLAQKNSLNENLKALGVEIPACEPNEPQDFFQEALKKRKMSSQSNRPQTYSNGKSDVLLEQILMELRNLNKNLQKQEQSKAAPINEGTTTDSSLEKTILKMVLTLKKKGLI